ncbi:hypothetical protein FRACYDRAFT_247913 [Fragilariopsis cylindrus CCMP1102]|uniref:Uncharacterized protein n=1 Tax=Fragilariopsis cylindrus CCMP1102 TaxID=635003 RepID=A0A1E7EUE5_9STRA|nr:hypothetical protein FRACYDRAFT_247913 [Fragilariopsis cylindrus CCMP1102]|eukprot:OEU09658.1 hypothetical protein FRACYDRAFT_247913 [Fragilariopsis cylindrus CCMP1102]
MRLFNSFEEKKVMQLELVRHTLPKNPVTRCGKEQPGTGKKRCRKKQPGTGKKVRFFCPATCKDKCKNTISPTSSPTDTPTSSPTYLPTTSPTDSPTNSPSASPSAVASTQYRTPQISSDARQAPSDLADRRSPSTSPPSVFHCRPLLQLQ